ncbi:MAG: leucyl/phenylalanyl-tRNA--protein transferase [Flavobacteriales bacterium]|nr:leucyl/phenylalanyl-tRNA--protein transferase [Flavobacteriales bacterium]
MPTYLLNEEFWFPPLEEQDHEIVAVGGDLSPERLLLGYVSGIFPWYNEPGEIMWWNPFKRCVLFCKEIKVSHSMRNVFNKNLYRVTFDQAFSEVMQGCRSGEREGETWIHTEVVDAYCLLHALGYAHSVEVWDGEELVGGLYGVSVGSIFFGESMFSKKQNSSKFALIKLAEKLNTLGFELIDCQVYNDHLGSMGAKEIDREHFIQLLNSKTEDRTFQGNWSLMPEFKTDFADGSAVKP